MDKEKVEGNWEELKGRIQSRWGKITDDDLDVIQGDTKILVGKLMEKYGMSQEAAEKSVEHIL